MESNAYEKLVEMGMEPNAQERSIDYLTGHLGRFLKKQENVLICFQEHKPGSLSDLMARAVQRCGAIPVIWGPDRRWKTLLQQAFYSRATAVIGPPLIILGLTKLKKQNKIPVYIRRVITAGYPCLDWMIDGIIKGLDCETEGCFTLNETGVVAGFSCAHSRGIHLRTEEYGVDIVDEAGCSLPMGEAGEIVLYSKENSQLRFGMKEQGRLVTAPCKCGSSTSRLIDLQPWTGIDKDLVELGQYLHSWMSILDCRLRRGEYGLEIEIICFPGEKLPKLPTAAKLVVRPWNPKNDEPFWYMPARKGSENP